MDLEVQKSFLTFNQLTDLKLNEKTTLTLRFINLRL